MVNLTLEYFNSTFTMTEALLKQTKELLGYVDACGVIELNVDIAKTVFLYQTSGIEPELKYYVCNNPQMLFNPGDAKMDISYSFGAIMYDVSNNVVMNDYLRYLSLKLFGTPQGVNLFINENELLEDLSNNFLQSMIKNMKILEDHDYIYGTDLSTNDTISQVYDYSLNRYVNTYTKYSTDNDTSDSNICRQLLLQMLKLDPSRFQTIENTPNPQPIPFINGDSINFKITVNAAEDQHKMTDVAEIPSRIYQIKVLLVNSGILFVKKIAHVLYTNGNAPTIAFQNTSILNDYDYVLFRFSIYHADTINHYMTGLLQIYPAALYGDASFSLINSVNGNTNYEINGPHGRMFYSQNMVNVNSMSDLVYITCSSGELKFNFIQNSLPYNLQVELLNPGLMNLEDISTKYFDTNLIY